MNQQQLNMIVRCIEYAMPALKDELIQALSDFVNNANTLAQENQKLKQESCDCAESCDCKEDK